MGQCTNRAGGSILSLSPSTHIWVVALYKSEGVVKQKFSLAMPEHRDVCPLYDEEEPLYMNRCLFSLAAAKTYFNRLLW
jgi:hypothetical protein